MSARSMTTNLSNCPFQLTNHRTKCDGSQSNIHLILSGTAQVKGTIFTFSCPVFIGHIKTGASSGLYKDKKSLPQTNILKVPYQGRSKTGFKSIPYGPMPKEVTILSSLNATLYHVTSSDNTIILGFYSLILIIALFIGIYSYTTQLLISHSWPFKSGLFIRLNIFLSDISSTLVIHLLI